MQYTFRTRILAWDLDASNIIIGMELVQQLNVEFLHVWRTTKHKLNGNPAERFVIQRLEIHTLHCKEVSERSDHYLPNNFFLSQYRLNTLLHFAFKEKLKGRDSENVYRISPEKFSFVANYLDYERKVNIVYLEEMKSPVDIQQ